MIDTSHPGTTPHDTETASDLDSAARQAAIIGDWAASLAELLKVAFGRSTWTENAPKPP